jgi:hypothetical protein
MAPVSPKHPSNARTSNGVSQFARQPTSIKDVVRVVVKPGTMVRKLR